jgi:3-phosphoshikimate 1-carboxyvinyltransferase
MSQLIVRPSGSLRGAIAVPGDKSISHRALLLGALAEGETRVTGWLAAEDCQATLRSLRDCGVRVDQHSATELTVYGAGPEGLQEPANVLDCGGSGTTMRLLAGVLAGRPFFSVMTGTPALRRRPMARVADPLRLMGANVAGRDGGRLPPLAIQGTGLHGIEYRLPVASAQVKSAILLAGLFAEGQTVLHEPGPSRDHTERMLRAFGAEIVIDNSEFTGGGPIVHLPGSQRLRSPAGVEGAPLHVPGDFSSAAFFLIAGALVPAQRSGCAGLGSTRPARASLTYWNRWGRRLACSR